MKHKDERLTRIAIQVIENKTLVDELKKAPCADCKQSYPPICMDFDHLDPSKKYKTIAQLRAAPKEVLLAELAKCELVCANCHRIRTAAKKQYTSNPVKPLIRKEINNGVVSQDITNTIRDTAFSSDKRRALYLANKYSTDAVTAMKAIRKVRRTLNHTFNTHHGG